MFKSIYRFFKRLILCPIFYIFKIVDLIGFTISVILFVVNDSIEAVTFEEAVNNYVHNLSGRLISWARQ
jgi:hypothetical protein